MRPSRTFSRVLLPAPLGPRTAMNSPSSIGEAHVLLDRACRRGLNRTPVEGDDGENARLRLRFPCRPYFPRACVEGRELAQHPVLVIQRRRHGFRHRHDRDARRFRLVLELCRDRRNGLLVVDQYLDLLPLHLVLRDHDRVGGRIVAFRDGLLELERREDRQPERFCLVEEYRFRQADGRSRSTSALICAIFWRTRERDSRKVLRFPEKNGLVAGSSFSELRSPPARSPGHCPRCTTRAHCREVSSARYRIP